MSQKIHREQNTENAGEDDPGPAGDVVVHDGPLQLWGNLGAELSSRLLVSDGCVPDKRNGSIEDDSA